MDKRKPPETIITGVMVTMKVNISLEHLDEETSKANIEACDCEYRQFKRQWICPSFIFWP